MSERPEDPADDVLRARLESAFEATPARLSWRLERLAAAGLRPGGPEGRAPRSWRELVPRWIGAALLVALVAGLVPRLAGLLVAGAPLDPQSPGFLLLPTAPGAFSALMLPIGVLLGVEALRGAPTVRRWLR